MADYKISLFFKDCRHKHAPYSSWFKATYNLIDVVIILLIVSIRIFRIGGFLGWGGW
jgi:hypothetical protein